MTSSNGGSTASLAGSDGSGGYSANVRIRLCVDGETHDVAQVADELMIFAKPTRIEGTQGVLIVNIDASEHRWAVRMNPMNEPSTRLLGRMTLLQPDA